MITHAISETELIFIDLYEYIILIKKTALHFYLWGSSEIAFG